MSNRTEITFSVVPSSYIKNLIVFENNVFTFDNVLESDIGSYTITVTLRDTSDTKYYN
jgi:hypothetical protein